MDDQAANIQLRIDAYRQTLVSQFTAMENVVSQYKSIGSYLTRQFSTTSSS
jgi:flagellar capping protein FliD